MLNDLILKTINEVDSVEEFEFLISKFKMSDAVPEIKLAAIKELRKQKRQYDKSAFYTCEKVLQEIESGFADIDDIVS